MKILYLSLSVAFVVFQFGDAVAKSKSLKISEKTKFYKIRGQNASEFALSMSKNGPYSRSHRKRAWATAARSLTYQLVHKKYKSSCRIKDAKVTLNITYTMPKLAPRKRLSKRERRKWKKMYALLNKHERTHGLYYRQFAAQVRKNLRRMKPARTCRSLVKRADAIVKKLSEKNRKRNQRFDERDKRNYRRMERLYSSS